MSSRDFATSHIAEHDAHSSHQNVQQVIESIMQAIAALLKQLKREPEGDREQAEEGPILTPPEMAESPVSVEPVDIREQQLALAGAEPVLLNAAPPYQLEGQSPQELLKGSSAEPWMLEGQVPNDVSIQVGDTAVEGQYGDELRAALMQFSPEQLEQLHQAVDPSAQADIIDAEWEPIEIKVNGEPVQVRDVAEPELEKPEPVHTELLSADQVERSTGQDYSDLDINDVGPVIATVDDQGRILDKGYVQQQIESRVEDAREEDEIAEQRTAFVEGPEVQRVDTPSSTQEQRSIETLNQLLNTVGADRFKGDRFVVERRDDLITVTEKEGRGLILVAQGEQVLMSELTSQDLASFDRGREVLNRESALDPGIAVEAPTLEAPALELTSVGTGGSGFELD